MKYYLAYWKYDDWNQTKFEPAAYHSDADILSTMPNGSKLWLFTRRPRNSMIHIVQMITVDKSKLPNIQKKKAFVVSGTGLTNPKIIEEIEADIGSKNDCLKLANQIITERGKRLTSDSGEKFAQRVQKPIQITAESFDLLNAYWKKRFD